MDLLQLLGRFGILGFPIIALVVWNRGWQRRKTYMALAAFWVLVFLSSVYRRAGGDPVGWRNFWKGRTPAMRRS